MHVRAQIIFFTNLLICQQHYVMTLYVEFHPHHSIDMKDKNVRTDVVRPPYINYGRLSADFYKIHTCQKIYLKEFLCRISCFTVISNNRSQTDGWTNLVSTLYVQILLHEESPIQVAGSCACGNEHSFSIKRGEFIG
jgi:hypothetical protein